MEFCDVAKLAIIHNWIFLNMAIHHFFPFFSFWVLSHLTGQGVFFLGVEFCDVAKLAIIHNWILLNMAIHHFFPFFFLFEFHLIWPGRVFFFGGGILWRSQTGDHPQLNLAKYGYTPIFLPFFSFWVLSLLTVKGFFFFFWGVQFCDVDKLATIHS